MKKQTPGHIFRAGLAGRAALALGILCALAMMLLTQASAADMGRTDAPDFAAIDSYVEMQMEENRLPGMALGIVKGDKIVHLRGFGEADDSGRSVTPQTPFIIGSNAKSFTALAIMQLVEEGKVELDAPVRRYIPWFRVADPEASWRITVRHLLNQTSGLPATVPDAYLLKREDGSASALEKGVRSLSTAELSEPVGEVHQYCNMNYATLGLIVQTVSGKSYERYVEEHILAPLKMDNSFMSPWEAERHGLATGHEYWFGRPFAGGGMPYNRASTPSGLIASDAEDMSHYLIAQLNGGRYGEARILSPEGVAELHRGVTKPVKLGDVTASYGMGWADIEAGGTRIVAHNGDTGDFHAKMLLAPKSGWGVVVLMNGSNSLRQAGMDETANVVMARLVGNEPIHVPGRFLEPAILQLLLVLAVSVLQVAGIARSVMLLRRWRAHPERRPRGVRRTGLRLGVPIALNLAWLSTILYLTAGFSTESLVLLKSTDVGWAVLVSGAVALLWGVILKPVLAFFSVREGASSEVNPPKETEMSVKA